MCVYFYSLSAANKSYFYSPLLYLSTAVASFWITTIISFFSLLNISIRLQRREKNRRRERMSIILRIVFYYLHSQGPGFFISDAFMLFCFFFFSNKIKLNLRTTGLFISTLLFNYTLVLSVFRFSSGYTFLSSFVLV